MQYALIMGSVYDSSTQSAEAHGAELEYPLTTSFDLLWKSARQHAHNLAIISMHKSEDILSSLRDSKQGYV